MLNDHILHGSAIHVLDHGFVRLVDHMGSDLAVSQAARVSYAADWRAGNDAGGDEKLIRYLMKNKHTSPFESVVFKFEIKCPLFVARQWHRHRTWAYSEVSARYTELPEEYYIPDVDKVGTQSQNNKQQRVIDGSWTEADQKFCEDLQRHSAEGFRLYQEHLAAGVPRELARCFLGLNTYTRYFGTVNLHNLLHFIRLRFHSHAQYEIYEYADALMHHIFPIVPVTVAAFKETI